ncbi:MAG TPA: class IV adenylate cyclase [Phototrophicaceae bacterium]|nr:class IV adenylate cyclase [Phototrophicaceae bacterium]
MSNYIETEVKLYVPYLEAVQTRLETLGGKLTAPRIYERNVRYDDPDRSLTPAGVVLRLRQDTRTRLTYKAEGRMVNGITSRFEAEVEVSDFDAMATILGKLGYSPYMVYEKYRTTYELDGAEVVLDEMPYGHFVEIEGDEGTIEIVINRLNLLSAPRYDGSYAVLFERVRRALGLTFTDLTFENFTGMVVPESAFSL